jgi:hypothetical protein
MITDTDAAVGEQYDLDLSAGTLLMAAELTSLEKNEIRLQKKQKVELLKLDILRESAPAWQDKLEIARDAGRIIERDWPREDALNFLIDLAFVEPYAPYELGYRDNDFRIALGTVAALVGVEPEEADKILSTKKNALKAHIRYNWLYLFISSIVRTIAVGFAIFFAAPLIGTFLSTGLGFMGISVANQGLALLHAGTIDPMTAGLMGGRVFASGVGNLSKSIVGGAGSFLYRVGSRQARIELGKLQVNFREVLLTEPVNIKAAENTIARLKQDRDETRETLEAERKLNDRGSDRIVDIEQTVKAINGTIRWMEKELSRVREA